MTIHMEDTWQDELYKESTALPEMSFSYSHSYCSSHFQKQQIHSQLKFLYKMLECWSNYFLSPVIEADGKDVVNI